MTQPKLFISYRRSEHDHVLPVKRALDAAGIDCFLDTIDINPLDDFPKRITDAIGASHIFLAWWSKDYGESDHCVAEFKLAWQHARRHGPDVGRRVWVLNPETGTSHVAAGEVETTNFLSPPDPGDEAAWTQAISFRIAALLPEGPLCDERQPHTMPGPLYGVPTPTRFFVGRNTELMRIHSLTHPARIGPHDRDVAVRTHGLGGIGKTELALQYARQFSAAYPGGVFWLNFARFEPQVVPEQDREERAWDAWKNAVLYALKQAPEFRARLYDAEGKPLPPAEMRRRLVTTFNRKERGDFLWVLDNVPTIQPEDLREAVLDFWRAPGAHGRTLITTRDSAAIGNFRDLCLDILTVDDSLRLLATYCKPQNTNERAAALALVDTVGSHTQALVLLARWIEMTISDLPYTQALAEVTKTGALKRIEEVAIMLTPQLGSKARGIVATFEISLRNLNADALELLHIATSVQLLGVFCILNLKEGIQFITDVFGNEGRRDICTIALGQLKQHSLLTSLGESMGSGLQSCKLEVALRYAQGRIRGTGYGIDSQGGLCQTKSQFPILLRRTNSPRLPDKV